jgi:hypothetical protein
MSNRHLSNKHLALAFAAKLGSRFLGISSTFSCAIAGAGKDTGSAHAANLFSSTATVNWLSGEAKIKTFRVPSTRHQKSFCGECGSAVPRVQMNGALVVVPAGSLDSAIETRPDAHILVASSAGWDRRLEDVPRIDGCRAERLSDWTGRSRAASGPLPPSL